MYLKTVGVALSLGPASSNISKDASEAQYLSISQLSLSSALFHVDFIQSPCGGKISDSSLRLKSRKNSKRIIIK